MTDGPHEEGTVPQEKLGQYWQYIFKFGKLEQSGPSHVTFYGFSVEEAKKQYAEWLGIDLENVPEPVMRKPW